MHVIPPNGFPNVPSFADLDEIAKKIDGMPTFTSNDRAWLDEWENKLPELPANPEIDGVKVLTATTENGETILSYEDIENSVEYSLVEKLTLQKWVDGKDIYFKTIDVGVLPNAVAKNVPHGITNFGRIVKIESTAYDNTTQSYMSLPLVYTGQDSANNTRIRVSDSDIIISASSDRSNFSNCYVTLYYTKTT